jgi:hypothetical protein
MTLKALERRDSELTELQKQYLDILVDEYGGYIPYGEKTKIAKRLGCNPSYLSRLDNGQNAVFAMQRKQRIMEAIPMADTLVQLGQLQALYDSAILVRKNASEPLTSKDPADLIDLARKITQGTPHQQKIEATQNIQHQSTVFNFKDMDGEALSRAIQRIETALREENFDDVVDGNFEEIGGQGTSTESSEASTS